MQPTPMEQREFVPDDALPPVEPPSAGFLLQLFIIPAVIVAIIVGLYWGVNKLAHGQADPKDAIAKIRRKNSGSWQAASTLADQLRNPHSDQARRDSQLASELGKFLDEELEAGQFDEQPIILRYFVCKCLGEFEVTDGLPALLHAATTFRHPNENQVRLAALESIAVLASKQKGDLKNPQVIATVLAAADDTEPTVRNRAAIVLGALADPDGQLTARLERMLHDANPDTRFNAAAFLARQGHETTLEVLLEMLEPDGKALEAEAPELREQKRLQIVCSGLISIAELAKKKPDANLTLVRPEIEKLRQSPAVEIRKVAEGVAQMLEQKKS
jgi:hypothetical protein